MPDSPRTPRSRSDAVRNRELLVAAASAAFARDGAQASLERIARDAGVGSATLHRHFGTRQALLDAVFHDRVLALEAAARDLAGGRDPAAALASWLRSVAAYVITFRGLDASLTTRAGAAENGECHARVVGAGATLVGRAKAAGALRDDVTIEDLLVLVNAISISAHELGAEATAVRLLDAALAGLLVSRSVR